MLIITIITKPKTETTSFFIENDFKLKTTKFNEFICVSESKSIHHSYSNLIIHSILRTIFLILSISKNIAKISPKTWHIQKNPRISIQNYNILMRNTDCKFPKNGKTVRFYRKGANVQICRRIDIIKAKGLILTHIC